MVSIEVSKKENFDVIAYLEEREIHYDMQGDNVSSDWIGLKCVFCSDHKNHLGVSLRTKMFHCWLCGETGDIVKLIRRVEGCSFIRAKNIINSFQGKSYKPKKKAPVKEISNITMPLGFRQLTKHSFPKVVESYLKRRNFTRDLIEDYKLGFCKFGDYNLSLIVPIFVQGKVVSYQAVDATGTASARYKDCPEDKAVIPNKNLVYGIDDIKDQMCIVEGVTDRWAMGKDYAVATLGKKYTREQFVFLMERTPPGLKVKVVFDPDAAKEGRRFASDLCAYYRKVMFVRLHGNKDPGILPKKDIMEILRA